MSSLIKEPIEYLNHIRDEVRFILEHIDGMTFDHFATDEVLKRAVVRSLEIIGEAASKVPEQVKTRFPSVEWRAMTATRNRLIHGYFGVDYQLVWDIVVTKLPKLEIEIKQAIAILRQDDPNC